MNKYADLKGKCAVVTGSSRGIGYAIAEAFCANDMSVAMLDVTGDTLVQRAAALRAKYPHLKIEGYACNVAERDSVDAAFCAARADMDRIDVLVNNAGILRRGKLEEMSDEDWNLVHAVNVNGPFHCCRAVLPYMKERGAGAIVNVSSNVATMPSVSMGAYCVSKSAVETLTKVLAAEYAPYGVRVNAYAPGVVATEMTRDILQQRAEEKLRTIPIGRFTEPEEIASLVLFLVSDASSSIDGTVVAVDGGMLATHNPWKAKL